MNDLNMLLQEVVNCNLYQHWYSLIRLFILYSLFSKVDLLLLAKSNCTRGGVMNFLCASIGSEK